MRKLTAEAKKIIQLTQNAAAAVTENELQRLRLQEELLTAAVTCQRYRLGVKQDLIQAISDINKKQLYLLGAVAA